MSNGSTVFLGVIFDEKCHLQAFSWNHVSDDSKWRRCTWLSKGHFIQKTQWNNHFKKVMILQFLLFIHICSTKCFKVNTCKYNWNVMLLWNIPSCTQAKEIYCFLVRLVSPCTCLWTVKLVFASLLTQSSTSQKHFELRQSFKYKFDWNWRALSQRDSNYRIKKWTTMAMLEGLMSKCL